VLQHIFQLIFPEDDSEVTLDVRGKNVLKQAELDPSNLTDTTRLINIV